MKKVGSGLRNSRSSGNQEIDGRAQAFANVKSPVGLLQTRFRVAITHMHEVCSGCNSLHCAVSCFFSLTGDTIDPNAEENQRYLQFHNFFPKWVEVAMQQAAATIPHFERDLHLNDTSWSQLPLLGGLVQKLRRGLHSIALFYTNRALQHQQQVNKQLWESVGRLTAVTQTQQRTIQALQAQLAAHTQANSE